MRFLIFMILTIIGILFSNINLLSIDKVIYSLLCLLVSFIIGDFCYNRSLKTKKLKKLEKGCLLLEVFLSTLIFNIIYYILLIITKGIDLTDFNTCLGLIVTILFEIIVFWRGMVKIYLNSLQLGIKKRVVAFIFSFIPGVNIYYLIKMISLVLKEVDFENTKLILNDNRKNEQVCKTKYPILLVHGVFFRDFRYFDYWGRIPKELIKNGATVYYGEQESADTCDNCGKELALRIKKICEDNGYEKLNIIAHSKGGLDCRVAISKYGAFKYVASLSTINTPHNGCLFAEALLDVTSSSLKNGIAKGYNTITKKFGDKNPDFLGAVYDLTNESCLERNKIIEDKNGILYESYMSYCKKATSGRFPLNISYPIVSKYDGLNDGLVALDSAKWGSNFTLVEPKYSRGISHGDMIDLNRENIKGFDVREFYVDLVNNLKKRGY